eukprot:2267296-Amphidinium_carterae.1
MLLEVITGDPAMVLQEESIDRLHQPDGLQHLLHRLKVLEEQPVQSVGGAMREYENIRRGPDELLRAFVARFLKVEQRMSRVGLRPFTEEARGWKLLHSCQLTGHDMRNVLTTAGNQYDVDEIRKALELQFLGVPPAHFRQGGQRKGGKEGKDGKDSKGGKGGKAPKQVYAAEAEGTEAAIPEGNEQQEQEWQADGEEPSEVAANGGEQYEEGAPVVDDADAAMMEAAEVLSVTANRLKALTQGRGWKGSFGKNNSKGQPSAAHFTAHGSGGKGGKDGKSWGAWGQRPRFTPGYNPNYSKGKPPSTSTPHPVHQTEWTGEETADDWWNMYMQEETAPTYQAYVTTREATSVPVFAWHQIGWQVDAVVNDSSRMHGLAVLDTACQRSVAGVHWLQAWEQNGGSVVRQSEKETFRFGVGQAVSDTRCSCPVQVVDECVHVVEGASVIILNMSIVDVRIPFLMSRHGLEALGACIDLAEQVVVVRLNGKSIRLPLLKAAGHLAMGIRPVDHEVVATPEALRQDVQIVADAPEAMVASAGNLAGATADPVTKHAFQHCQARLLKHALPLAHNRTNVTDESTGQGHLRSLTVGAYTTRGVGVTQATLTQVGLVTCLHALAATQPEKLRLPYLTCTVSSGQASLHTDDHNEGQSLTIALGDFTGGQLEIGGTSVDTNHHWCRFEPKVPHRVLPYRGHRVSITFYAPRKADSLLTNAHFRTLEKCGFPVKAWWEMQRGLTRSSVMSTTLLACFQCGSTETLLPCQGLGDSCKLSSRLCEDCRFIRAVCSNCLTNVDRAVLAQTTKTSSRDIALQSTTKSVGHYASTSSARTTFPRSSTRSSRRAKANDCCPPVAGHDATCLSGVPRGSRMDYHVSKVDNSESPLDPTVTPTGTGPRHVRCSDIDAIPVPDTVLGPEVCSTAVDAASAGVRAPAGNLPAQQGSGQVHGGTARHLLEVHRMPSSLALGAGKTSVEATSDCERKTSKDAGAGHIAINAKLKLNKPADCRVIQHHGPSHGTHCRTSVLQCAERDGVVRRKRGGGVQRRLSSKINQLKRLALIGEALPYRSTKHAHMDVVLVDEQRHIDFATLQSVLLASDVNSCRMTTPQRRPSAADAARLLVAVEPTEEMADFMLNAKKKGLVQDVGFLCLKGEQSAINIEQRHTMEFQCAAESFMWFATSSVWRYSGLWSAISNMHVDEMSTVSLLSVLVSIVITGLLAIQPTRFLWDSLQTAHD